MKLLKRAAAGAALMGFGFAFAHQSMTNISTSGLFATDVDNFIDVNEWQSVEPENMFGYLGFGADGKSKLHLGLAKQFGSLYFGVGFAGVLPGLTSTTKIGKDSNKKDSNSTTVTTEKADSAQVHVLAGFGDIGILLDATYTPQNISSTTATKPDNTVNNTTIFDLDTNLKFGLNKTGPRDLLFKSFVTVGLESKVKRTDNKRADGKTRFTDDSEYVLLLAGGTSFDYKTDGAFTQNFGIELENKTTFAAVEVKKEFDDKKTKHIGGWKNALEITPKWTFTFEPSEAFALSFSPEVKVGLPLTIPYDYEDTDGKKKYVDRETEFGLKFTPALKFGTTYFVKPEKLRFNAGTTFAIKEFGWNFKINEKPKDDTTAGFDADKKSTETSWTFYPQNTIDLKLNTGFTFFLNDAVTIDASWNIFNNLLDRFSTKFKDTADTSIWNTANQLLVHNFAFLVSVKF